MKIRDKLLLAAGLLALAPVLATAIMVGVSSYTSARDSLTQEVQSKLVTLRENKRAQINDHLNGMVRTVQALGRSTTVIDAFKGLNSNVGKVAAESGGEANAANYKAALNTYYTQDFAGEHTKRNAGPVPDMRQLVRGLDSTSMAMQYHYIANNPNPLGHKEELAASIDGTSYSKVHAAYHPSLLATQRKLGYYDIFLIDAESSRIIYTVRKEIDFSSRLNDGVGSETGLAKVVAAVSKAKNVEEVAMSDYAVYLPSYYDHAAFIATPIFDSGKQIGVLAVQLPIDQITAVMTSDKKWKDIGLGNSGEAYLVGPDKLLRSESRFFLEDKQGFLEKSKAILSQEKLANAVKKQTSIGNVQVDTEGVTAALSGKAGVARYSDYRGINVVGAYAPFNALGLTWGIFAEQDAVEVYQPVEELFSNLLSRSLYTASAILIVTVLLALLFIRTFIKPVNKLQQTVSRLAAGDFSARADLHTGDEMETLGNALDKLVHERLEALAKAERENEELNLSVIELLQSVSQVSERDLTVQAEVNDNMIGTLADSLNLLTRETAHVLMEVRTVAEQVDAASQYVKSQAYTVSETAENERKGLALMMQDLDIATLGMTQISELAENSSQAATQAIETTRTAQRSVSGTLKGMGLIRDQISEVERRIKQLGERSQEIGQIVSLINTISERTHALALNASIQAAMAGDAGRGFAVVAEEVQRLAESARAATSQITQLVQNIQFETNDTINTVNKAIEQVVSGSLTAEESGDLMQATQETTARLVELVKQIAGSAEDQEKMAEILRKRATEIGISTEQTARQVVAQNESADILVSSARQLVASVLVFKLPA